MAGGPVITQIGVTAAVKAEDVPQDQAGAASLFRDLGQQLVPKLQEYVGGIQPKATPAVNVAGPEDDTFQGVIYAISLAAPFETDDLPSTCGAYAAHNQNRS